MGECCYVGNDQKNRYERRMQLEPALDVSVSAQNTQFQECDAKQRYDSEEIGPDCDDIGRPAPSTCRGQWDHRFEDEVDEDPHEVDASNRTGQPVERSYTAGEKTAVEQDEQLGYSDRLSQNHRDCHEEDQIPRLVSHQQLHVVGHVGHDVGLL